MELTLNRFGEPMTEKEWEVYINHSDWRIRKDIAFSETTPLWVLEKMVNDEDIWVLYALIKNPKTTSKMLDEIMEFALPLNYVYISYGIIRNPKSSEDAVIKKYAYDKLKDHLRNRHTQGS